MSSRALRKAQREREEQERLAELERKAADLQEEDEGPDEEETPSMPPAKSAFAMLGEEDEEDEEDRDDNNDDDGGTALENDKEVADDATSIAQSRSVASGSKSTSNKKKKKKKKGKSAAAAEGLPGVGEKKTDDMDEIDRALKQLSTQGHAAQAGTTSSGVDPKLNETNRLLAIDTNHLHAQNEMKRLFGRAALEQGDDDEEDGQGQNVGGNRRQQRRVQQAGLAQALRGGVGAAGRSAGLAAIALRRNIFIQGKEDWPVATGGGLGMEIESKNADGTVLYRFVHNRQYQDVQGQFETCVESMDPNRLVMLLRHNPYHISTLLQVSEIAKQDRDHATSGDLLERALFSLGRAVHSTFAKNLAEGKARLDFRRAENREFWLAAWRYMLNLSMRGTWRTVYEWTKLLLSLSPAEDPYALWLVLDQYALRSRQDLDFLNLSRNPSMKNVHHDTPNIALSQGLAECRAGNKRVGQQALFKAIGQYPWVVARLMQELSLDPPPAIWGKEPRTEKEKFYTELYATRAKDLWNTPENCALLTETAAAIPPETSAVEPDASAIEMREARHVILSDTPALIALLPRSFTARLTSASDPLPPDDSYPSYLADRQPSTAAPTGARPRNLGTPAENLRELQGLYGFFSNLFPWFHPTADNADDEGNAADEGGEAADEANEGPLHATGAPDARLEAHPPRPDEAAVAERIRASGVSEEVIVERTRRMMVLQQALMGGDEETEENGVDGEGTE
ncbi:hypothetical protein B0A50_08731 [Salinomyces thailandicus]|uniref:DUF654-domain-containing protein n=1 Tax=Salinomyces thailandicus TaxID=706561 RepID=A0A4V5N5G3_9PEZI|nr:hypothetical protein B0A50_08731 [Salinomyces thailandica]